MSRASQQHTLLIQHCCSPYGTIQLEKTNPIGPVEVLNDLKRVLHGISLYCKYCMVFDCFAWYCIASYCILTFSNMYRLNTRAGVLPRSASSHFFRFNLFSIALVISQSPPWLSANSSFPTSSFHKPSPPFLSLIHLPNNTLFDLKGFG